MSSQNDIKSTYEYEVEIKGNLTIVKIPEIYDDKPPTEEQKKKILEFQEEFSYRYTDDDEDYVALVKLASTTPPLISSYRPFWNRKRNDRSRGTKRTWEDRGTNYNNGFSHYSHNKRQNYGYNNDYRR